MSTPKYPVSLGLTVEEYNRVYELRNKTRITHKEIYLVGLKTLENSSEKT